MAVDPSSKKEASEALSPGVEQLATTMTRVVPAVEEVPEAQERALNAMRKVTWPENALISKLVMASEEEEAMEIVLSVINLAIWLVSAPTPTQGHLAGLWSATSASRKVIWPETVPMRKLMVVVAEAEEVEAALGLATSAKKKVTWLEIALTVMQEETLTKDLATMMTVATQEPMQEQALLLATTTGVAVLLPRVVTGMREQGLEEAGTTTSERQTVRQLARTVIAWLLKIQTLF